MVENCSGIADLRLQIDAANRETVRRMVESTPVLVAVRPAGEVVPELRPTTILHAGPPIAWERMCEPQRRAVCGALVYEGLADSIETAASLVGAGDIRLAPCHEHRSVGSMAGAISWSMPVLVVRNTTFGNEAFCHLYEHSRREKLSYGTYNTAIHTNLKWQAEVLGPVLDAALKACGGVDLRALIARALAMGDECHSRNEAATALFVLELAPALIESGAERRLVTQVLEFLRQSSQFALHVVMAACKASADAAAGVSYSTVVTAIARNGVETGIRVSGLGDRWFKGPAGRITGLYFSGFGPGDGQADLGDSAITETVGLGAFAHAAAPSLALVKGGNAATALDCTERMRTITVGENSHFPVPWLNGRGVPVGIDVRLVLKYVRPPVLNTAVADRRGRGQIGLGQALLPLEAFRQALQAFAARYGPEAGVTAHGGPEEER